MQKLTTHGITGSPMLAQQQGRRTKAARGKAKLVLAAEQMLAV